MNQPDLLGALDGSTRPAAVGTGREGPPERECSRRGCRRRAAWRLEWNNPRIHTPDRRKTWLACQEHRDWLAQYLESRGLLKEVLPLGGADEDQEETA